MRWLPLLFLMAKTFLREGSLDLLPFFLISPHLPFRCSESHSGSHAQHGLLDFSCHIVHSPWHNPYRQLSPRPFQRRYCSSCFHFNSYLAKRNSSLYLYVWIWWDYTVLLCDCRTSSFSYLSLNCSYSDFFIHDFSGEASHTYFFRRKVSASRILQVPGDLFPEFFQKLFAVCSSQ